MEHVILATGRDAATLAGNAAFATDFAPGFITRLPDGAGHHARLPCLRVRVAYACSAKLRMISWIAGWVALCAGGMLVAMLADGENRRRNALPATLMAGLLAAATWVLMHR